MPAQGHIFYPKSSRSPDHDVLFLAKVTMATPLLRFSLTFDKPTDSSSHLTLFIISAYAVGI